MKKITYYCDRCKTEIPEMSVIRRYGHDLCESCDNEAAELITSWVKRGPQTSIDWGKAQALRDAGWTLEAIAKEVGAAVSSIHRNTKKPSPKKQFEHESPESEPAIIKSPELI